MERPLNYNTKQREAILSYVASLGSAHVTAAQIAEHFGKEDFPIGRTTIYRHLDKLTQSGKLRKYTADGISGACYQHMDDTKDCHVHLHLKCDSCGTLRHLDCSILSEIQNHISSEHSFQVNALKTVLYGKCEKCS